MNTLQRWAKRHGIPDAALEELRAELHIGVAPAAPDDRLTDEGAASNAVRVLASQRGDILWRNNVGAGMLESGSFVRWGLCNDSAELNKRVKSADLIGIRRVLIAPEHVGRYIGQFYSVEAKRPGWSYSGTPREQAQARWAQHVNALGGFAEFSTGGL